MRPQEIAKRRARIRLPKSAIAAKANLDKMTVVRALRRDADPRSSTLEKIEAVVLEEERRLLDHLIALHGVPERKARAA